MKRITFSLIVVSLLFFSSNLCAQGIGVGIKAGANFAKQDITNITTDSRTGFNGGAYVVLAFSEKWAIQPELLFSSQGSELPSINEVAQLNYFSIPVLVRWKPIKLLSFHAGPQFSSLLSAVDKSGDSIKEDVKNSDFGLALGAGVHLPLGINGGVRYVWGFGNVSDYQGSGGFWPSDAEVKNRMIQIYVGWTIFGAN